MIRKEGKNFLFDKSFWIATFTLTGTVIGAGILGLPYVFSKSGFFLGLFWLLFLGVIIILTKLYLGEVILRTKQTHQLPGYAKKYLGKWGGRLMVFEMFFGVYTALLAYLIGEGESFSMIITNSIQYEIYFAIGFWIIMTLFLREGLRGLKKVESYGVIAIIVLVFGMFLWSLPQVNFSNLYYNNINNFFIPLGVVLFALLGFSAIPEVKRELNGKEKYLRNAIFLGAFIPIIVYMAFTFVFVSILGNSVPQVATLAFGKIIILVGIFTMVTSFFVLSFALKDMFRYDFNYSKKKTFFYVSIVPLLIYLLYKLVNHFFDIGGFTYILGIGGVISAGLTGILALLMNLKAKKLGDRKPEYSIGINWFIIILLSIIFILGIIVQILS